MENYKEFIEKNKVRGRDIFEKGNHISYFERGKNYISLNKQRVWVEEQIKPLQEEINTFKVRLKAKVWKKATEKEYVQYRIIELQSKVNVYEEMLEGLKNG